jgi:predicted AlkP superfamily pyrophosphatase or phosphodiesterase
MPTKRACLMVWDGLRPDQVSPEVTPHLHALAQRGVWFERSHAVFPSVTRANSAAIATGCRPGRNGVPGNAFMLRSQGQLQTYSSGDATNLERLAEADGQPILLVDTLADRVHRSGGSTVVVGSGSPGSGFLQHPRAMDVGEAVIADGIPALAGFMEAVQGRFGPLPSRHDFPASKWTDYFTRIVTEFVIPELQPTLLVFWHTDPDHTSHYRGYGAPETVQSLRDADAHLGALLATYERLGLRDSTAIVVTSDHGGSTIGQRVRPAHDLGLILPGAGVAENGGAVFVYSADRQTVRAIRRLNYAGPIFTRNGRDGTFPLSLVGLDGPRAPDVVFSLRWDDDSIRGGLPGTVSGTYGKLIVEHGSLSPFDLHNTLAMEGPDFRPAWIDPAPVGNIDICPTLVHVLGLDRGSEMDGRVLREALRDADTAPGWTTREEEASSAGLRQRVWFEETDGGAYLTGGAVDVAG